MRWQRPPSVPPRLAPGEELLRATALRVDAGGRTILRDASLTVRAGELVALVGPNGAGKSTLLRALSNEVDASGSLTVLGRDAHRYAAADLALRRSVLPQDSTISFPFCVADVVRMGRAPWARTPGAAEDDRVVADAMQEADVAHLATRTVPSLSGGERARTALARVRAQRTQLTLLDEPTAALDVHHQERVFDLLRRRADAGDGLVVVVHDLGLAAAHADRIVVLSQGAVVADGAPDDVLAPELLSRVYDHDLDVVAHPCGGTPLVVPVRADRRRGSSDHRAPLHAAARGH